MDALADIDLHLCVAGLGIRPAAIRLNMTMTLGVEVINYPGFAALAAFGAPHAHTYRHDPPARTALT
jgi:hypothetical protein